MTTELLRVQDVALDYRSHRGTVHALAGVSLSMSEGEMLGLVGESGCGKTSLARALTGVLPGNARITQGQILWRGQDLLTLSESEHRARRWRDFAFVPQSAMNALNPVQRVSTQLLEVLRERSTLTSSQAHERMGELFDQVGIDRKRLGDYPHQFSGGMRQRISMAMALALRPQLLIADEPVTALDVIVQRQILDLIVELRQRLGLSMIMVTHDVSVVAYVCDSVVVMYAGQVVEQGPVAEVLERPLHPYTMGLTRAFPDLHQEIHTLQPIEGSPPDLRTPPVGCRFAPRCPFATDHCRSQSPALEATADTRRRVACLRADEADVLRTQWSTASP